MAVGIAVRGRCGYGVGNVVDGDVNMMTWLCDCGDGCVAVVIRT